MRSLNRSSRTDVSRFSDGAPSPEARNDGACPSAMRTFDARWK